MKISKNSEGIGWQKENSNTNTDGLPNNDNNDIIE